MMQEKERKSGGHLESSKECGTVKLKLKTLVRTDEAYLIDLGQGKVWIPKSAIKSTRRVNQGILEIEVLEDVVREERKKLRRRKEKLSGLKGSVTGEVVEVKGKLIKEVKDSLWIEFDGKDLYIPKVCFSEQEELPDGRFRFVIQKNFLDFKLRQLQSSHSKEAYTKVKVGILRETDRAYLFSYEGTEIWFPKREVMEINFLDGSECEIMVPTDFWNFKIKNTTY